MTQHSDPWYYLLLFCGDVLCMYEGNHAVGSMPDSDMRALTPCKRKNSPREHLLGLTSLQESHPGELLFGLVSMQKSPPSELLIGLAPPQKLLVCGDLALSAPRSTVLQTVISSGHGRVPREISPLGRSESCSRMYWR